MKKALTSLVYMVSKIYIWGRGITRRFIFRLLSQELDLARRCHSFSLRSLKANSDHTTSTNTTFKICELVPGIT